MWNKLKTWWLKRKEQSFLVNFTCQRCGKEVFDNEYFCEDCREKLPWQLPNVCPRCGRKTEKNAGICQPCKELPPIYLRARSPFSYEGEIVRYIHEYKNGEQYYSVLFGREMTKFRPSFLRAELIVPVPLTEKKCKKRGYNQAELLAKFLAKEWDMPCRTDLISKVKEGEEQKSLSRKERRENAKGIYHLNHRKIFEGKGVVIVDDIMTTGSTVNEIARLLQGAGASFIYVLTVASTPLKEYEK